MKLTARLSSLGALLALLASPALAAAPDGGPTLLGALSGVASGRGLVVERTDGRLTVRDHAHGDVLLLTATEEGVVLPTDLRPPARDQAAATRVVRDRDGSALYTVSATGRGARLLSFEPGVLAKDGLAVVAFDNDDVHVADGAGRLLFSRVTSPEGGLLERAGAERGCGCEREIDTAGHAVVRALPSK